MRAPSSSTRRYSVAVSRGDDVPLPGGLLACPERPDPWTRAHPEEPGVERVDVLVVGGGPAGSSLAWGLRRSGMRVRVMDRRRFPRDKTCAGWVTPPVWSALQIDPRAYAAGGRTLQPIRGFQIGRLGGAASRVAGRSSAGSGAAVDAPAGARRPAPTVPSDGRARLTAGGSTATRTRLLVGAGGHFVRWLARSRPGEPADADAAQRSGRSLTPRSPRIDPESPRSGSAPTPPDTAGRSEGHLNVAPGGAAA
jgi:hypothetical protein